MRNRGLDRANHRICLTVRAYRSSIGLWSERVVYKSKKHCHTTLCIIAWRIQDNSSISFFRNVFCDIYVGLKQVMYYFWDHGRRK